jgi:predicted nucleotidyltransferase
MYYKKTMRTLSSIRQYRPKIEEISARHGIDRLRVFGSLARGDNEEDSDVDFLVKLHEKRDLLDLIAFSHEVGDVLHCKVDVVSEDGVSPYLREHIFKEAVFL